MADTTRKLADIAEILGIPESECRLIADEHEALLPYKKIGKIRVYDENIVDRFRKIADLRTQGLPQEVIAAAIKGGKTLEEQVIEDIKRMEIQTPNEPHMQAPKPTPRTETDEEVILAIQSVKTAIQTMDYRISTMREKITNNNTVVLDAIAKVAKEVASLRGEVHTLWDQIASLEQYFHEKDAQKKFRFWKR